MAAAQALLAASASASAAACAPARAPRLDDEARRLGRAASSGALRSSASVKGAAELQLAVGHGGGRTVMQARTAPYICRDCGYIYNDPRKPFESLTSDYGCPVCQAPKRRFKPYDAPVAKNANDLSVRKSRKEELKKQDAAVGAALPALIGAIFVGLIGVAAYFNSQL